MRAEELARRQAAQLRKTVERLDHALERTADPAVREVLLQVRGDVALGIAGLVEIEKTLIEADQAVGTG